MNPRWPRFLVIVGRVAFLAGALDPLEGSLVIVAGSILILLGSYYSRTEHAAVLSWIWISITLVSGVACLWLVPEFGAGSERSMWWALALVPYPVAWLAGAWEIVREFLASPDDRKSAALNSSGL